MRERSRYMLNVGLSVYRKEDWSKVTYIGVSLLWPRQAIRTTLNFRVLRADPDSRQHLGISLLIPVLQLITFFMKPFSFLHLWNWNLKEDFICSKLKDWYTHRKVKFFRSRNASASILWILLERKPLLKTTQS